MGVGMGWRRADGGGRRLASRVSQRYLRVDYTQQKQNKKCCPFEHARIRCGNGTKTKLNNIFSGNGVYMSISDGSKGVRRVRRRAKTTDKPGPPHPARLRRPARSTHPRVPTCAHETPPPPSVPQLRLAATRSDTRADSVAIPPPPPPPPPDKGGGGCRWVCCKASEATRASARVTIALAAKARDPVGRLLEAVAAMNSPNSATCGRGGDVDGGGGVNCCSPWPFDV